MLQLPSSCKRLQFLRPSCRIFGDSETHLRIFQKEPVFIRSYASKSPIVAAKDKLQAKSGSFTLSYLINSCGLSPEIALNVSKTNKRVHFDTPEGPDSVLNLLKSYGLNDTHISLLVKKRPRLLLANAEKTLTPKLKFLGSIGLSSTDLARIVSGNPDILIRSLQKSLIPCYRTIKSVLLPDKMIPYFLRKSHLVSTTKVLSNIAPNISFLRALQVPEASISLWVGHHPSIVSLGTEKLKENVEKVMSMGVHSTSATFMKALLVITLVDSSELAQKMELYRKWGWTEDEMLLAFRKNPLFMNFLEKNFSSKMDFLVNKMGWQPADVAGNPTILTYSLEKWILPRCSVIRVLQLKDIIGKGEFSLTSVIIRSKENFLDRFVIKYIKQVPELLSIFEGKMGLVELGLGYEDEVD